MSILGTVVRVRPEHLPEVAARLGALPGVDLALNPGDGRLVAVIEDTLSSDGTTVSAAGTLAAIAQWPLVLNTSLVYEYSGPDSPAPDSAQAGDYRAWRGSLGDRSRGDPGPL
jgi:periplasmic nitrate reductase NapD